MSKNRDIEDEMSKFEEELSKLTSTSFATPKSQASVQQKHKISIQMPTSLPASSLTQPTTSPYSKLLPNQIYHQPLQHVYPHAATHPHKDTMPHGGIKRDSSGKMIPNQTNAKMNTITPAAEAASAVAAAEADTKAKKAKDSKDKKKKKIVRSAGGQTWEDETLLDWENDDFRLFCGDLGNEVTDESLARAFQRYPTFLKAKVIRDRRTGKSKGYGFVSFKNSEDFIKAMREMNGKYVGNRPIKLRKSNWKDRNLDMVRKKEVEKQKMGLK